MLHNELLLFNIMLQCVNTILACTTGSFQWLHKFSWFSDGDGDGVGDEGRGNSKVLSTDEGREPETNEGFIKEGMWPCNC